MNKKYDQRGAVIRFCVGMVKGIIRFYQLALSPYLPSACRFVPTCSCYALEALERHGLGKGLFLAAKRILRCHPFCRGGYDPVP